MGEYHDLGEAPADPELPNRRTSHIVDAMLPTLARFALNGKVILVTGAGRGLEFEIANALAGAGGHVILNGRDAAKLDDAARRIEAFGGSPVQTAPFDVSAGAALCPAFSRIR